jgi:excisionase family DNA binding protein
MFDAQQPIACSIPDLARETGLSESLLYQKANEGSLQGCRRIGKRFLIHRATFEDWLKTGMGDELENE